MFAQPSVKTSLLNCNMVENNILVRIVRNSVSLSCNITMYWQRLHPISDLIFIIFSKIALEGCHSTSTMEICFFSSKMVIFFQVNATVRSENLSLFVLFLSC